MAPRIVTTTLNIRFGADQVAAGADALIAEVDERETGLNAGKTSFAPGDEVFILLYQSDNVTVDAVIPSLGTISKQTGLSPQIVELEESVIFANVPEANVSRPIISLISDVWLGTDLGGIIKTGDLQVSLSNPPSGLAPNGVYAGVNTLTYNSRATVYKLTNTFLSGVTEYDIVVVFVGTAI